MLTVLDEYTREALCVEVRSRMGATDVLEALYPLLLRHGKPTYIRPDTERSSQPRRCLTSAPVGQTEGFA
jgi:hypothetical protein